MYRLMALVTVPGLIAAFALRGWRAAAGFLLGAALSFLNFRRLAGMVSSIAQSAQNPEAKPAPKPSTYRLAIRYLLLAVVVYAIVKYFEVNLMAALLGLFVAVAAVVIEMLLELFFP